MNDTTPRYYHQQFNLLLSRAVNRMRFKIWEHAKMSLTRQVSTLAEMSLYWNYQHQPAHRQHRHITATYTVHANYSTSKYIVSPPKKHATLFLSPWLSNINRFQHKLVRTSWKKHLTKLCRKCIFHINYVLTLPWKTWGDRLSHQRSTLHFNESLNSNKHDWQYLSQ